MRIYLIDDDNHLRGALEEILQRAGHDVRAESNGVAVSRLLNDWPADLVVCDMLMPDAEGFEVLRAVRSSDAQPKFIMMSGASGEMSELLAKAPMLGADAVLQKPFAPDELLDLIGAVVGQPVPMTYAPEACQRP